MRKQAPKTIAILSSLMLLFGCTSSRWIADKKPAIDRSEGTVLKTRQILIRKGEITPDEPVLTLNLVNIESVRYPERLVMRRYIQKFHPRYGHLILGIAASAFILYTAHSDDIIRQDKSGRSQILLNAAGLAVGLGSFLDMKPVGQPRATGEKQMTKQVDFVTRSDTVDATSTSGEYATFTVSYRDSLLARDKQVPITDGKLLLNLATDYNPGIIAASEPGSLMVEADYHKNRYDFHIPLTSFMQQYAVSIKSPAPLYNEPAASRNNLLTSVGKGTYLRYLGNTEAGWYKVLLGITPAWLKTQDARLVWKSSRETGSSPDDQASVSYGNIDVEQNIPEASTKQPHTAAILMSSTFAGEPAAEQAVYDRDIRLVRDYLTHALGVPSGLITSYGTGQARRAWQQQLKDTSAVPSWLPDPPDSSCLIIYYSGAVDKSTDEDSGSLTKLIRSAGKWNTRSTLLLLDIHTTSIQADSLKQVWLKTAALATAKNPHLAILFSSDLGQNTHIYRSSGRDVDKMHTVFTYYFCRALQMGLTDMANINPFLQRNIAFTSRSVTNQPQDPVFFGDADISLVEPKKQ